MIQITADPISKNYTSHVISRSFFISYFCYILVLIIPAAILINIQCTYFDIRRLMARVQEITHSTIINLSSVPVNVSQ